MWAVGDLAICVKAFEENDCLEVCDCGPPIPIGQINTIVEIITEGLCPDDPLGFVFVGRNCGECYCPSQNYRKINPLTEEEREEFLEHIKSPVFA